MKNKVDKYNIGRLKLEGINFFKTVIEIIHSFDVEIWIEYGSLLGYVRHNDLIPWDSEFDLGILKSMWNSKIEEELKKNGYILIYEPSRIKLKQPNAEIGVFTIDIHIHEVEGEQTKLLFGELKPSKSIIFEKIYWFFEMTAKVKEKIPIRYLSIMKSLSSEFNILDNTILEKNVVIKRGKYNHEKSFKIIIDDYIIEDFFFANIKWHRRVFLSLTQVLPNFLHQGISNYLLTQIDKPVYIDKFQQMPLTIYKKLEDVLFCGINIKAPLEKEFFLESVYGVDWKTPNMNFSRQQMKNLSKK